MASFSNDFSHDVFMEARDMTIEADCPTLHWVGNMGPSDDPSASVQGDLCDLPRLPAVGELDRELERHVPDGVGA